MTISAGGELAASVVNSPPGQEDAGLTSKEDPENSIPWATGKFWLSQKARQVVSPLAAEKTAPL